MTALENEFKDDWGSFSDFASNGSHCNCGAIHSGDALKGTDCILKDLISEKLPAKMAACILAKKPELDPKNLACDSGCSFQEFEDILQNNEIWKKVVNNYGVSKPVKWSGSSVQTFYSSLLMGDRPNNSDGETDEPCFEYEDSELRKLLDMHSLYQDFQIDYNGADFSTNQTSDVDNFKPVQTADEVIEEIEEILLNADEQDAAFDDQLEQQTGIIIANDNSFVSLSEGKLTGNDIAVTGWSVTFPLVEDDNERTKNLKRMSFVELNEKLGHLEGTVKYLSENLLKELNLRDELLYEKEVRSTFVSKILEVQCKQEQFQQNNKVYNSRFKLGKLTKSFSMSNASVSTVPGRFLTTVIPFDDGGVPSMESLQALIKLLDAIKEDSSEVPSLITGYILKVLCPAPTGHSTLNL